MFNKEIKFGEIPLSSFNREASKTAEFASVKFVNMFANFFCTSWFAAKGFPPSEFFSGLYKFLHQIETAFDQKDSILIGDLLEYEVAPMMHHLLQYASDLASDEK